MENRKIYTQGSFDILHSGHVRLLESSKALGTHLTVSVLSDECYEEYRGYPPMVPFSERSAVIKALRCVDEVIKGDNTKTGEEILMTKPRFVAIGSDWAKKDIYKQYRLSPKWFDDNGIILLFLPYTLGVSSTGIKNKI